MGSFFGINLVSCAQGGGKPDQPEKKNYSPFKLITAGIRSSRFRRIAGDIESLSTTEKVPILYHSHSIARQAPNYPVCSLQVLHLLYMSPLLEPPIK